MLHLKVEKKKNLTQKDVVIYYVNICLKNVLQNISYSKNFHPNFFLIVFNNISYNV
jgi:general stress protein CsbA